MAALQKTYKGDLSTAIAGVLWSRIKEADNKRKLEKSNASEDVKQAARELNKEDDDPQPIPVRDSNLRDTVVKIFGGLEGRLVSLQGKTNNISAKITTLAGGISDTQKLIINQNQLLEDKFDIMLQTVGGIASIERRREAEADLDAIESELERGLDLSGTFAYEKTNTGSFGIFGKMLSGILGNRFTAQLIGQISKSLIPKSIRARGRLLRRSLLPVKKFARKLAKPGSAIAQRFIQPFAIYSTKQVGKIASRFVADFFDSVGLKRFGRGILTNYALRSKSTEEIAQRIIQIKAARSIGPGATGRVIKKRLTKTVGKEVTEKTPKILSKTLADGVYLRAINSPKIQRELVKQLGVEGAEKIGIKLAQSGVKGGFPIIGTGYAVIEGLARLIMGDPKGMLLSFGSAIPAAGWGFAAIDILRDIDRAAYERNIEPNLPIPSDANIAAFFTDALGVTPDQYEMGNVKITSPLGIGNNMDAILEILSVTKAFGDHTGYGGEADQIISESGLGSFNIPKGNYKFDVGKFSPVKNIEGIQKNEEEKELRMARKEKDEDNDDEEPKVGDVKHDNQKNFFGAQQGREGYDNQWFDFWDWLPDNWFNKPSSDKVQLKGEGGIGGKVIAQTSIMGGDASTIEFYGQQGRDRSGEPGVDFSFKDYKNNYNLFPGYVLETGLLYGKGYGNVVVVRSTDPSNGKQFDSLYSHFPDGGIAVKAGQQVGAGDLLGSVGFVSVDTPGVPQLQPNNAGNMSGWHTSVDFFEPDSPARYSNADSLINLVVGARNSTPHGLLESLKPVTSDNETSLNSISSNTNLASTMTNMVESGSSERLMTQRKVAKKTPIVIVNNQVISNITNATSMGMKPDQQDFFEAFNLARYTV